MKMATPAIKPMRERFSFQFFMNIMSKTNLFLGQIPTYLNDPTILE